MNNPYVNYHVSGVNDGWLAELRGVAIPEMLTPHQWGDLHRSVERSPERRLLLAVLEDGLMCWMRVIDEGPWAGKSRRYRLCAEAEAWIFDDDDGPFSFTMVCEHLELDAAYMRDSLRRWQREQRPAPRRIRHHSGRMARVSVGG